MFQIRYFTTGIQNMTRKYIQNLFLSLKKDIKNGSNYVRIDYVCKINQCDGYIPETQIIYLTPILSVSVFSFGKAKVVFPSPP